MKTQILTAALLLGACGVAIAADAVVEPTTMDVAPVFSWTGGYVGLQAGYGWSDGVTRFPEDATAAVHHDGRGIVGGAYAGYLHHFASDAVLGVEVDAMASSISESNGRIVNVSINPGTQAVSRLDYSASLRARLGYAFGRFLPYATAGVAYARYTPGFDSPEGKFEDEMSKSGWTAGVGVEHAFTDRIVARVEYRYSDFGEEHYPTYDTPTAYVPERNISLRTNDIRIGVAYKF